MNHETEKKIFTFVLLCFQSQYCQSFFFQKQTTVSSVQSAAQEKIKNIVYECMEKEKSDPFHIYALFAINSQNAQAKCVLLCVMHKCNLMDEDGNYDKQKVEIIMNRTEPKPQSKFSLFGRNKAKNNETLKECIEKDFKADACDRAYIFTKCLQKQTKKSFNTLTGDLFDQVSEDNSTGTFNFGVDNLQSATSEDNNMTEIETTETTVIDTLTAIDYTTNLIEINNESTSKAMCDNLATSTAENTLTEENSGSTSETLFNISSTTTMPNNVTMEENIEIATETLGNNSSSMPNNVTMEENIETATETLGNNSSSIPDNITMEENIENATETLRYNSSLTMFNETTVEETRAPVIFQNSTETTISFNPAVNESKDSLPKIYLNIIKVGKTFFFDFFSRLRQ